jgi:hypothetical protein
MEISKRVRIREKIKGDIFEIGLLRWICQIMGENKIGK